MSREMGAVGSPMSKPGFNSLTGLSGAPISRPARVGPAGLAGGRCGRGGCLAGYELPWCDVTTPGGRLKGSASRGFHFSHDPQPGQPGRYSEPEPREAACGSWGE